MKKKPEKPRNPEEREEGGFKLPVAIWAICSTACSWSAVEKLVVICLCKRVSQKPERKDLTFPSQALLAKDASVSVITVKRVMARMGEQGSIVGDVDGSNRRPKVEWTLQPWEGRSNVYQMATRFEEVKPEQVAPKERLIALPDVSLGPPRYLRETSAVSLGAGEVPPRYPRETSGVSQGATNPSLILSPSGILSSPPETRHAPQSRRVPIPSEPERGTGLGGRPTAEALAAWRAPRETGAAVTPEGGSGIPDGNPSDPYAHRPGARFAAGKVGAHG
jgi:hypothetical protein